MSEINCGEISSVSDPRSTCKGIQSDLAALAIEPPAMGSMQSARDFYSLGFCAGWAEAHPTAWGYSLSDAGSSGSDAGSALTVAGSSGSDDGSAATAAGSS